MKPKLVTFGVQAIGMLSPALCGGLIEAPGRRSASRICRRYPPPCAGASLKRDVVLERRGIAVAVIPRLVRGPH